MLSQKELTQPPRPRRMFGIKDLFTTVNLLGGVAALVLCIEGRPFAAGLARSLAGWMALTPEERRAFRAAVAEALEKPQS